jgi:hypothetical protein
MVPQARCTVTPAVATGGETPRRAVIVMVDGRVWLAVTASLYKADGRRPAEVFVERDVSGLADDWTAVRGTATLPAHRLGGIVKSSVDPAARGSADQRREINEHLARRRTGTP